MATSWQFRFRGKKSLLSAVIANSNAELSDALVSYLLFGSLEAEGNERALREALAKGEVSSALLACISSLDTAVTVIVEHGYFDLDSRSEQAINIVRQYRFTAPVNDRLHFFSVAVALEDFAASLNEIPRLIHLRHAYLGYIVLRPDNPLHAVGRSVLVPPMRSADLMRPEEFRFRVRTKVQEEVTLAGLSLKVVGVPFIQQEGAVTACAHAAAWMAHYTAVLRGLTPRVSMADLAGTPSEWDRTHGRQYPTPGLSAEQLCQALWRAGLPPELIPNSLFSEQRPLVWSDREKLHNQSISHEWHHENFTTAVAWYLNSGLPVLITAGTHVVMVCGYLRANQMRKYSSDGQPSTDSRIAAFILHDDSRGPYRIVGVDALLGQMDLADWLMAPVPIGMLLGGGPAESLAIKSIDSVVRSVAKMMRAAGRIAPADALDQTVELLDAHSLSVRTYAAESNDFKRSFASRSRDRRAGRQIQIARLPKYIWVTEIVDRARRHSGLPPVLGEAIVDATSPSSAEAEILLLHLPGYITKFDRLNNEIYDFECGSDYYNSGRWAQQSPGAWSPTTTSRRFKSAGVS